MRSKNKDKLFESVKEAMTIKYVMYLIDKLYKEEKITKGEHELLINGCKEKLEDCCIKGGLLWKKEK